MEESNRMFTKWRQRCSGIGHIVTSLPVPITDSEIIELKGLIEECETGININGSKTKWTDTKASRVRLLQKKQKGEDELPSGLITHLNKEFRAKFWNRESLEVSNHYLEKGKNNQEDVMALHSLVDGEFYISNKKRFYNEYIEGEPDNFDEIVSGNKIKVRDAKANFELQSFEDAELIPLYSWQIRGYSWLLKDEFKLDYYPQGELCYGLTNSPVHIIQDQMTSMFYKMGRPDDDNEKWIETKRLIERRNIFDIKKFKDDYPSYIFENKNLDFDIPYWMRVKKFDVSVTQEDIDVIKSRVMMSRIYLVNREIETLKKMKAL